MTAPVRGIDVIVPVHNGSSIVVPTLTRLLDLAVATETTIRIIACDDGSTDETPELLASVSDPRLTCISLQRNSGRAAACNAAAAVGRGSHLLFLDVDCIPLDDDYFLSLAEHIASDAGLVYGPILGRGEGFWLRYLEEVELRRREQAERGEHLQAMTSANLMVHAELFHRVGRFSGEYRRYGFEDKDLIARLLETGTTPVFDPRMAVKHHAGNTVAGYCRKMREAARFTAPIFAARHPDAYRATSFAKLDPDLKSPLLGAILRWVGRTMAAPVGLLVDSAVGCTMVPRSVQVVLVKSAAALSYLRGAAERRPN